MDDIKLKILVFTGIALFALAAIGIFLVILKIVLSFYPEVSIMGIGMSLISE